MKEPVLKQMREVGSKYSEVGFHNKATGALFGGEKGPDLVYTLRVRSDTSKRKHVTATSEREVSPFPFPPPPLYFVSRSFMLLTSNISCIVQPKSATDERPVYSLLFTLRLSSA